MNLSLGIVGLPNVGKSTLFNALTKQSIPAENYPFCTIEPNTGIVPVIDKRLIKLEEIVKPGRNVPAIVKFVDIAGIVKGASKGEGLGNKFLSHIREVDAIVEVVRVFHSNDVIHVENRVDPKLDVEIIESELVLKDLETIDKVISDMDRRVKTDKKAQEVLHEYKALKLLLEQGKLAINIKSNNDMFNEELTQLSLLTYKPFIYVLNVSGREDVKQIVSKLSLDEKYILPLDIKLELEIASLPEKEQEEYIKELGLTESGLAKLTRLSYEILGLISFFTAGEMEVKAWTIIKGMKAPQAAGTIHTDFEKKFIAAEVVDYEDFVQFDGWQGARNNGKVRLEGRDYIVKDGDVMIFKHGA